MLRKASEAMRGVTLETPPLTRRPRLVVFTRVYPNAAQPGLGLFVRERMRRVAQQLDVVVVAPVPWFPFQSVLRMFRPHFRPAVPRHEVQDGIEVHHPRFLCVPGIMKWTDALLLALGSFPLLRKLKRQGRCDLLDAHFIYPDGAAARLLGSWLDTPYTITLRGSVSRFDARTAVKRQIDAAMNDACRVFSVADALRQDAIARGQAPDHIKVVGNGVDLARFSPRDRIASRRALGLPEDARILVSVGGLTERKGFHRVIERLPALRTRFPDLHFVVAGGPTPEGNNRPELEARIDALGLREHVHLLGPVAPDELATVYSAGDVFVLATRFEGWANVFLEASACGLPVVTTDVGGNREVIPDEGVGFVVPFGDGDALEAAIAKALDKRWDTAAILEHARRNSWQTRIPELVAEFRRLHSGISPAGETLGAAHER